MIKRVIFITLIMFACGLFGTGAGEVWAHVHEAHSPFIKNDAPAHHKHCPLNHHFQMTSAACPHLYDKLSGGLPQIARECGGVPDSPVPAFTGFQHNPMLDETVRPFHRQNLSESFFITVRTYQIPSLDTPQHPPKHI